MRHRYVLAAAAGAVGLLAGCVDRRFVVETNVPGAQVYVDGRPIGPSPADAQWEYAGLYRFTAVAPGYETLDTKVRLVPKWYNYPPFDFAAEVLWPFRIEDVRRVHLDLVPYQPVSQTDLLAAAANLRTRGQNLPPSSVPDTRGRSAQPGQPAPPPAGPGPQSGASQNLPENFRPPAQQLEGPPQGGTPSRQGGPPAPPATGIPTPLTPPGSIAPDLGPGNAPGR